VGPLSDRVVDSYLTTIQLYSIKSFSSLSSIIQGLVVEEGKPSATPTVTIQNHVNSFQAAILLKLLLQLPLRGVETQPKHPQALAWLGGIAVSIMAPTVGHGGSGVVSATPWALLRARPAPRSAGATNMNRRPGTGSSSGRHSSSVGGARFEHFFKFISLNLDVKCLGMGTLYGQLVKLGEPEPTKLVILYSKHFSL